MGQLVDGKWSAENVLVQHDQNGLYFKRDAVFRERVSSEPGWSFGDPGHIVPGTDRRVRWLHELYAIADPACTTRVTVPTLWDARTRRVVNNESSEIIRMFNTAFSAIAEPSPDYYPE